MLGRLPLLAEPGEGAGGLAALEVLGQGGDGHGLLAELVLAANEQGRVHLADHPLDWLDLELAAVRAGGVLGSPVLYALVTEDKAAGLAVVGLSGHHLADEADELLLHLLFEAVGVKTLIHN